MPDRPNIVMLITHDTGRHVSPYGVDTVDTPNCQRLADQSVRMANSFCPTPLCSPSRAAIVTGRYPHSNGVMGLTHADFAWDLNDDETPIAQLLGQGGYATWLMTGQHEARDVSKLGFDVIDANHALSDFPRHFLPVLDAHDDERPFYCQIGGFETHRAWDADGTEPDDSKGIYVPPYLHDGPETRAELAQFQGMVKRFDTALGQILDVLDQRGLTENTILVLTTDHGIAMPRAKSTLYDPGIETMLFMRYPGHWAAGGVCDDLVSHVDILPTLLSAVGVDVPDRVQGRSFLPALAGRGEYTPREEVFAEKTFHSRYDPMRAIRTGRFKYIRCFEKIALPEVPSDIRHFGADRELGRRLCYQRPMAELLDLRADPNETKNLAGEETFSDVERELKSRLAQWMLDTADPLLDGPVASPYYRRAMTEMFGQ